LHTQTEHVTIVAGTLHLDGERFDRLRQTLITGSFGYWPRDEALCLGEGETFCSSTARALDDHLRERAADPRTPRP